MYSVRRQLVSGHPFDTIKVKLQTTPGKNTATSAAQKVDEVQIVPMVHMLIGIRSDSLSPFMGHSCWLKKGQKDSSRAWQHPLPLLLSTMPSYLRQEATWSGCSPTRTVTLPTHHLELLL